MIAAYFKRLAAAHRRYTIQHRINVTKRDLVLTSREIAEKLEAKRELAATLSRLKCELNSL